MKQQIRRVLCVFGALFFVVALARAPSIVLADRLPDDVHARRAIARLIGLFLPSGVCLLVAMLLREKKPNMPVSPSERRRRVVSLTPRAAELAASTIAARQYPNETVLRIVPTDDPDAPFEVQYDLRAASDRDWHDESCGIAVVVENRWVERLEGLTVDACDGRYVFEKRPAQP